MPRGLWYCLKAIFIKIACTAFDIYMRLILKAFCKRISANPSVSVLIAILITLVINESLFFKCRDALTRLSMLTGVKRYIHDNILACQPFCQVIADTCFREIILKNTNII